MKKLCNTLSLLYLGAVILILGLDQTSRSEFPFLSLLTTFSIFLFVPFILIGIYALWGHSRVSWGAFFVGGVLFLVSHPIFPQTSFFTNVENNTKLEVMTFNTGWNHSLAERVKVAIEKQPLDLIALQEASPEQQTLFKTQLHLKFPHQIYDPDGYGIGLLSRYEIIEHEWLQPPTDSRLMLHALIEVEGELVNIFVVHLLLPQINFNSTVGLPTGLSEYWQAQEIYFLQQKAKEVSGPVLLMGDFNMSDQSHTYKELSDSYGDAFRDGGWGLGFTFPHQQSYYFEQAGLDIPLPKPMVRIDYIFYDPELMIQQADVQCFSGASDHCALQARFVLPSGQ